VTKILVANILDLKVFLYSKQFIL